MTRVPEGHPTIQPGISMPGAADRTVALFRIHHLDGSYTPRAFFDHAQRTKGRMRSYRYLDLITASFVAVLLISNIASTKIVDLKWFTFDGGTILFPLAYIFGDILTEVY